MLNTIRTVAAGPLTLAERSRVADALADLWVSRAAAPDETAQPDQKRIAATRADLPITRWVHAHLLATDRGDDAARVALGNRRVYATLGIANEALDCLVELLDAGSLSPSWVPRVRVAAGRCAYVCRDPRADAFLAAVEDLDERDFVYRVQAHSGLCASFADAGESVGALAEARLALEAAGASGDPALQRLALSAAGWAALRREAYDDAAAHARAQLALAETDADTALALSDVALAELFRESTDAALEAAGEALRLAWRQGQGTPVSQAQQQLGYALVQADDAASALPLLLSCLRSSPQHHDAGFTLETVASVGLAAAMLGERERGRQLIRECNAVTQALFDGELAISEPLRTAAAAHEIDISHEEDRVLPLRSTTDLVDEALALGEQLQMIGSK